MKGFLLIWYTYKSKIRLVLGKLGPGALKTLSELVCLLSFVTVLGIVFILYPLHEPWGKDPAQVNSSHLCKPRKRSFLRPANIYQLLEWALLFSLWGRQKNTQRFLILRIYKYALHDEKSFEDMIKLEENITWINPSGPNTNHMKS